MKIKKILVSQPKPETEKSPYHDLAEKNNLHIDFRPFVDVEGISSKEFRQTKVDILSHTAVIFTSKTAVNNFFRICEELRVVVPETMKYFCVTENVAFYLQKYIIYRKRKIFHSSTFADLLELLKKHSDETYLLPLSDPHKKEMLKSLDKAKLKYTKSIFYRTISSNLTDLAGFNYDMLVFFSPTGIKSLFDNFPNFKQAKIKIASFGTSTAKAVKDAGLKLDIKAPTPEAPSMAMAIEQYIKSNKDTGK